MLDFSAGESIKKPVFGVFWSVDEHMYLIITMFKCCDLILIFCVHQT